MQSKSALNIFQDTISKPNYDYDGAKMIIATKKQEINISKLSVLQHKEEMPHQFLIAYQTQNF